MQQLEGLPQKPKYRQQAYEARQVEKGLCRRGDRRKIFKWKMCRKCVKRILANKRKNYAKNKSTKGQVLAANGGTN